MTKHNEQFAARLEELNAQLSEREQRVLRTLLFRALDPLERMRLMADDVLDPSERQYLQDLDEGRDPWRT